MYKTALMQNYSLTLSRGGDNGASSLSVNWIDQDGMLKIQITSVSTPV